MLTAIGRTAAQRFLRAAPLAVPRIQPIARAACRSFSTSQWVRMPAKAAPSATTRTKKSTKDGSAATKKATKKTPAKKPKANVIKKPAPKKRVKKEVTPEEKLKLDVRAWKKAALLPDPKQLPQTVWTVWTTQEYKNAPQGTSLPDRIREFAESFKNLSSYELQNLQEKADENKLTNNAAYKSWVEALTPQDVAEANLARTRLRRLSGKNTPRAIRDERQPKKPQSSFALFTKARWASGDFAGQKPSEVASKVGEEWKALSQPEKGAYEELAKADVDRYERESLSVLGRTVRRSATPE